MEEGLWTCSLDANCRVPATCGPAWAGYMGILAAGKRYRPTNRNFVGRMGDPPASCTCPRRPSPRQAPCLGHIGLPEDLD